MIEALPDLIANGKRGQALATVFEEGAVGGALHLAFLQDIAEQAAGQGGRARGSLIPNKIPHTPVQARARLIEW